MTDQRPDDMIGEDRKVKAGQIWKSSGGPARVMAFAEGWIMLRQGTAMPYLCYWREFRTFYEYVADSVHAAGTKPAESSQEA